MPTIMDSIPSSLSCVTNRVCSRPRTRLYDVYAIMAHILSIKSYITSRRKAADQTQENAVPFGNWLRKRRNIPPSLMTIPRELRNRIYDFVFEVAPQPDATPTYPSNDHLNRHFNLSLCSRQLRQESYEKIFNVDRFFQDFEALDAWIGKGILVNPEMLPQIRYVGIQMGRKSKYPDCNAAYDDTRMEKVFSTLCGLRTLRVSSTHTLKSFVMGNDEIAKIMAIVCIACPKLEQLAFLVPGENLDFLYGHPGLRFLAITTPNFFNAENFISVVRSLPNIEGIRVRDKSCSSAFTPAILSQIPALKEIQLKDDTTCGRVVLPEMMDALLRHHGQTVTTLHLEPAKHGKEGTLASILSVLPKLEHLSTLKFWFDSDRQEGEYLESFLLTLPLLHRLNDLHLCFRPPKSLCPQQVWQRLIQCLRAGGFGMWDGEFWINEEGYVLDDGHSEWVRDETALREDEFYGTVWPSDRRFAWPAKGRYGGCMQVRAWR